MKHPIRTPKQIAKVSTKSGAALSSAKHKVKAVDNTLKKLGDPFALFTEWSGDADEKAFAEL